MLGALYKAVAKRHEGEYKRSHHQPAAPSPVIGEHPDEGFEEQTGTSGDRGNEAQKGAAGTEGGSKNGKKRRFTHLVGRPDDEVGRGNLDKGARGFHELGRVNGGFMLLTSQDTISDLVNRSVKVDGERLRAIVSSIRDGKIEQLLAVR